MTTVNTVDNVVAVDRVVNILFRLTVRKNRTGLIIIGNFDS